MTSKNSFDIKLTPLTKTETPQSVNNFIQNVLVKISNDSKFASLKDKTWTPRSENEHRGLTDADNCSKLDLMLGIIAGYCPIISRNFITEQACGLSEIWNRLKRYYGFRKTGARPLDLVCFKLDNQSYEELWESMYTYMEECLLNPDDPIQHLGEKPSKKETLCPLHLNILVTLWLQAIDPALIHRVKERFSKELTNHTLFSLREEIGEAIPSLLEGSDHSLVHLAQRPRPKIQMSCSVCKAAGRPSTLHFTSRCPLLSDSDRRWMRTSRSRIVECEDSDKEEATSTMAPQNTPLAHQRRVQTETSPILDVKLGSDVSAKIILDSGAESNLISSIETTRLGVGIAPTRQRASQADGATPLQVIGESHFTVIVGHHKLDFDGLVVRNLSCPIIGGVPFHTRNRVVVDMVNKSVVIDGCCRRPYDSGHQPFPPEPKVKSAILRVSCRTTILPGETILIPVPPSFSSEETVALEPRLQSPSFTNVGSWLQPRLQPIVDGHVPITNNNTYPVRLARHEQFCIVRMLEIPVLETELSASLPASTPPPAALINTNVTTTKYFSDSIQVDLATQLTPAQRAKFRETHRQYDQVFDPSIGVYNGYNGAFESRVNMGPTLPPQRKGRIPTYSHSDKIILQNKFDELLAQNVFARPEDIGITVEYVSPSFLVRKPSGGHRLVSAFAEVAQYCKPQPSLMPNIEDTLRAIGQWRYIVKSDLSQAYYQIPVSRNSQKYLGVCTPFKGVLVYNRCAMGIPGSETALEELLCRLLGHLMADGKVAKVADDLYCGGDSPEEVAEVWSRVLEIMANNNLRLSAHKTACCPIQADILGWIWKSGGSLSASPHRLSALETCQLPATVKALRSYMGAYKFLNKVIPSCSEILSPLDDIVAGRDSKDTIVWTDTMTQAFTDSQSHISKAKSITIPRAQDELQIVTDASVTKMGLAATLYVVRQGKPRLAGFFNAKAKDHQRRWLPCEREALCIGSAITHFAPFIVQSAHRCTVFTDSRPCVQAYDRMCKGRFSSSARVMTFLSVLCNYGVALHHISGCNNAVADYTSRNPVECQGPACQICKFIAESEDSVVRNLTVEDVLNNRLSLFSSRSAWLEIQKSCGDLKRVFSHFKQGTRPSKKSRGLTDIRRYLRHCHIASDGLLIKRSETERFRPSCDRIVIPRSMTHGVIHALHLQLSHPKRHQLQKVLNRSFFALNLEAALDSIYNQCDLCKSISDVPNIFMDQSTSDPSQFIGQSYSVDVIRRCKQFILVLRENVSSYTAAVLIDNETSACVRENLLALLAVFRSTTGPSITIRSDPGPAFRNLTRDQSLARQGVTIILGHEKNVNKNPVAERMIREFHAEFRRLQPSGGPITYAILTQATCNVNSLIRESQLSAREIFTQRDQFTGQQLPFSDRQIIQDRHAQRLKSQPPSAKFHARGKTHPTYPDVKVGDLIYLSSEKDKTKARNKYIIINIDNHKCKVQKFTGSQLRARQYVVDQAVCLPINPTFVPHQYTVESDNNSVSEDSGDDNPDANQDQDNAEDNSNSEDDDIPNGDPVIPDNNDNVNNQQGNLPRPRRGRHPPARFKDFVLDISSSEEEDEDG